MFLRSLVSSSFLLVLAGCAGGSTVSSNAPRSLLEVNDLLQGREARVELADGASLIARDVIVGPDSTRFTSDVAPRSVPTDEVLRITYQRDRLNPVHAALGGALTGLGVAVLASGFGSGAVLLVPILTPAGAGFGFVLGLVDGVGPQEHVAYEDPGVR